MSKSIYRNVHYRRDLRLGAAVAALLMIGGIAHAEDVADAAPAAESAGVDIMVTANRRDESLHDVPVSASVMPMEAVSALSASGQDMKALAFKVPSLNIESSNGRVFPRLDRKSVV
jgi:iron complex outermembrane receptor protein